MQGRGAASCQRLPLELRLQVARLRLSVMGASRRACLSRAFQGTQKPASAHTHAFHPTDQAW